MMDAVKSNKFAEWTKIVLLYCDGTLFQGYKKDAYRYKGKDLFFRGSKIMKSHLKWIDQEYNFSTAKKIVMAGISAGGMATYLWIDYLRGLVNDPKKVYGIVDSGIFLGPDVMTKYFVQAAQISSFFAPNALLAPPTVSPTVNNSQAGGTIPINTASSPTLVELAASLGSGQSPLVQSIEEFTSLINSDEPPPNSKCVDSLANIK